VLASPSASAEQARRREARQRRKDELIDLYHGAKLAPESALAGVTKEGHGSRRKTSLKQLKR